MKEKQKINLRGEISGLRMQDTGDVAQPASLNRMAGEALHYLENNPNSDLDYECRFAIYPSKIPYHQPFFPPNEYGYDTIAIADTDLRMQMVWEPMRRMAGIAGASAVERGVNARALSYIGEDGCVHTNPAAFTGCPVDGIWLSPWGTAYQLVYLCDRYALTGDESLLSPVKTALDTLWSLTEKLPGMADFPYATPYLNGEWVKLGWSEVHKDNYVFILEPMLRYYELTGDDEYRRRAVLIGEAFVNSMIDTRGDQEVNPVDGSFAKHTHIHTRCALAGMSHLAYTTGDSRYLRWARRMYDFVLSHAPGFGWYPEVMPPEIVSETCVNGDIMWAAYYLALCGELDCYDEMERNWRNYLRVTQFYVTPDVEAFVRRVNADKSKAELDAAIEALRKLEGGFIAQVTWNDLTQRPHLMELGRGDEMLYMMGCCPPSAMLALRLIYDAAVMERKGAVYVNLSVTADTPYADLTTDYASADKLVIRAKAAGDYYLRVPEWTAYGEAEIYRNGERVENIWDGPQCRYLKVSDVREGDELRLRYPLVRLTQKLTQHTSEGDFDFTFEWLGNSVLEVSPKGTYIDLFGQQRGCAVR